MSGTSSFDLGQTKRYFLNKKKTCKNKSKWKHISNTQASDEPQHIKKAISL